MNDMRTKLLLILFLCLPFGMSAGNSADNGYDDIDGFFEYCSKINSQDMRYTYISRLMMSRIANQPIGDIDLKSISDKVDFIQSVYVAAGSEETKGCIAKVESLSAVAMEKGFERVMSYNKNGIRTNIYVKSGYGGLNSLLMTNVAYVDGKVETAVAALIGGVFTHEEILSLLKH